MNNSTNIPPSPRSGTIFCFQSYKTWVSSCNSWSFSTLQHSSSGNLKQSEDQNPCVEPTVSLISSHLSLNHKGCWGTRWFCNHFLHFFMFSTAFWDLVNSRPVHSLMLSSHLFLCLPCLLPPFTEPCKMVLARPDEWETWPYHCSLRLFTTVRSSCGPIACWILAQTSSLVTKCEILSRIAQTTAALIRLKPIWNDRSISLSSNMWLMCSLVTSIFLYACESQTLTAQLQRRVQAVEMSCYRKILCISYKDHVTNEEVCANQQRGFKTLSQQPFTSLYVSCVQHCKPHKLCVNYCLKVIYTYFCIERNVFRTFNVTHKINWKKKIPCSCSKNRL